MHTFSLPSSEVFYKPDPTTDILPRISVLWLVLSNPWHLFVPLVDGPVAKSSAFCLEVMEVTNLKH